MWSQFHAFSAPVQILFMARGARNVNTGKMGNQGHLSDYCAAVADLIAYSANEVICAKLSVTGWVAPIEHWGER
jgi:hypothetical protein